MHEITLRRRVLYTSIVEAAYTANMINTDGNKLYDVDHDPLP